MVSRVDSTHRPGDRWRTGPTTRDARQIPRFSASNRQKFLAEFRLKRPAVLTGGLANWPGTLFDLRRLADRFGALPVLTYRVPSKAKARRMSSIRSDFYVWSDRGGDRKQLRHWTFARFLAALRKGSAHYCMINGIKNSRLRDLLAAETGEFSCFPLDATTTESARCEFFIGSKDTGPGLHHDGAVENFLCQLIGAKRVTLFSPADVPYLYPADSWLAPTGHFSAVADSFHPDYERYPLFRRATAYRCRLDVGDVLYIPPYWYHDTSPQGTSATVTLRNAPPSKTWGTAKQRHALNEISALLYRSLGEFGPRARLAFASRLAHDLLSGLYGPDRNRKPPKG